MRVVGVLGSGHDSTVGSCRVFAAYRSGYAQDICGAIIVLALINIGLLKDYRDEEHSGRHAELSVNSMRSNDTDDR